MVFGGNREVLISRITRHTVAGVFGKLVAYPAMSSGNTDVRCNDRKQICLKKLMIIRNTFKPDIARDSDREGTFEVSKKLVLRGIAMVQ